MAQLLTIGRVAANTGITAKTIRYYEEIGVFPGARRSAAGYRQYTPTDVDRLRFISRARSLGLPLRRLRVLTAALNGGRDVAFRPELRKLVHQQLDAVQRQIGELDLLRQELQRVMEGMGRPSRRPRGETCRCLETDKRRSL